MTKMPDATARALILAIKYIEEHDSSMTEDDDVRALEEIAAELSGASSDEKACFVKAAIAFDVPELPEQMGLTDD
jgi:hypothetical protein